MVQCCWLWLVGIIWKLVWTSTWQLGVESRKYAPMSNGSAKSAVLGTGGTLCECRERRRGYPAVVNSGENCCLGEDAGWYGRRRAYLGWQKSFGERTRVTPKAAQRSEENGKAHRGQTELDQQRIQTPPCRKCNTDGMAREPQSTKRNPESGLRGDQDSQRRPAERRQKQEPLLVSRGHGGNSDTRETGTGVLERVGFEETSWMDTSRFDGGNCWLDNGSPETQQRSGSKEEKITRDDREGIKERCQNGRRFHGWSGWFSVIMRVLTRILQAWFEWKRLEEEKSFDTVECCDRSSVFGSVELERGRFVKGLYGHFPVADFDAHRLGCVVVARMFQKIG